VHRLVAGGLLVLALAGALAGCSQSNSPAAPIAGVDKARAVQQQSNTQSSQLEQRIDNLQP
jgi:hypothetical protein